MAHFLIVDDEGLFLIQIKEVLQMDGHDVVTANGGKDALNKLKEDGFDMVITDLSC